MSCGTSESISFAPAKHREATAVVDGAPIEIDEPATGRALDVGPAHVSAVDRTIDAPYRPSRVAWMQIQQLVRPVLALHSDVDVRVAGEVAIGSAVAARQLGSHNPELHAL
jgi:hypothetical protein